MKKCSKLQKMKFFFQVSGHNEPENSMDISQIEENEENYEIQISSSDEEQLEDSKEEHHHKKVPCPKCPKLFKTEKNLENHIAMIHDGKSKSFIPIRNSERRRREMRNQDVDNSDHLYKPFHYKVKQCPYCQKWFSRNGTLRHHIKTVSTISFYFCPLIQYEI